MRNETVTQLVNKAARLFFSECKRSTRYIKNKTGRPRSLDESTVLHLLSTGLSAIEISERFGVHRNTVSLYKRKLHAALPTNVPRPTKHSRIQRNIAELVEDAVRHAAYCCRQSLLYNHIGRPYLLDRLRVAALIGNGLSQREISEQLGCHRNTVNEVAQVMRHVIRTKKCPCGRVAGHRSWCSSKNTDTFRGVVNAFAAKRPYEFFLGFMAFGSMHSSELAVLSQCIVKACPFPRSNGLQCRYHASFFEYPVSMTDWRLGWEDLHDSEDNESTLSIVIPWWETLVYEHNGKKVYEQLSWRQVKAAGVHHGVSGLHHGHGPSKSKIQRSRRKHVAGNKPGGQHPEQKPLKRYAKVDKKERLPVLSPEATNSSEYSSTPIPQEWIDEMERSLAIDALIKEQQDDMRQWFTHSANIENAEEYTS